MLFTGVFLFLYFYISFFEACGDAQLPHVLSYDVVRLHPVKRRIKRTDSLQQEFPITIDYALEIEGKNLSYTVHLKKNRELLGKDYTLTYYTEDGMMENSSLFNNDHCYYQGYFRNVTDSAVSLSLCSGMRGFMRIENEFYMIEPLEDSVKGPHALYKQEHLRTKRKAVRYTNDMILGPMHTRLSEKKTMAPLGTIRYIEMVLVVDNAEYKRFKTLDNVQNRMMEIANHVDKLYRPLNIRVRLVGLEVWTNKDLIVVSNIPNATLTNFLKWRQATLMPRKKHDNAQFVTAVNFEGSTIGLAPLYTMCSDFSGAVNQDYTTSHLGVATTIAHEMGHNLGMPHDEQVENCVCPSKARNQNCVMSESIGFVFPEAFSICSKVALETFLQEYDTQCLLDIPHVDGGPLCGNNFVEAGEACDCGTLEECTNPCCNATTCQLTKGSQCVGGECCKKCQLREIGSVCRPNIHDCDLEEYCTGTSPFCPQDEYKMNGLPCNFNQGYCYNGRCPTHKEHCKWLWGPGAEVDDESCFSHNIRICSEFGARMCSHLDLKCGKLYCTGGNPYPITKTFLRRTMGDYVCKMVLGSFEKEDIGNVPTGTKCGANKVCYKSRCHDITIYENKNCSAKCNNHGVCNHEKQCHCDPGWAPPYCDVKLADLLIWKEKVIIGVSTTIGILFSLMIGFLCYRKLWPISSQRSFRNINTYPGQSNPGFQPGSVTNSSRCGPPHISQPVFVTYSTTQHCRPLYLPSNVATTNQVNKPEPPSTPAKPSGSKPACNVPSVSALPNVPEITSKVQMM